MLALMIAGVGFCGMMSHQWRARPRSGFGWLGAPRATVVWMLLLEAPRISLKMPALLWARVLDRDDGKLGVPDTFASRSLSAS